MDLREDLAVGDSEVPEYLPQARVLRVQGEPLEITARPGQGVAAAVRSRFPGQHVSLICANAGYGGPPLLDGEADEIQKQLDVLTSGE